MRPVLPLHVADVHQFQVSFMNERGGLNRSTLLLVAHIVSGDASQFLVDPGNQFFERILVAAGPGA